MMKYLALTVLCLPVSAQTFSTPSRLDPDAQGCADSKVLPKLELCRIDNCEKKDSDHREVPIREDEHGDVVTSSLDGDSRSVMYECVDGTMPSDIVRQAATSLRATGFEVPYQFSDK